MKGKYLITTDAWFYAPNGQKYKSAWGTVEIVEDSMLGVKTNRGSTNWYAKVGSEDKHIIIAGCQIHYAVKCDTLPNTESVKELTYSETACNEINRPSEIYIAE